MTFDCPYCGQNLDADFDLVGQSVKCPSCENDIVVPRAVHASKPPERLRNCPFCSEQIKAAAIKCKHCGNMLDGSAGQDSRGDEFWVKALDRRGMEEIVSVRAESHAQALKRVRQRGYFPIEVPTAVSSSAVAAEKDQGAKGPGPLRIALNKWVSGLIVILLLIRGGAWLSDRFRGPSEGEGELTNQATASAGSQASPQEGTAPVAERGVLEQQATQAEQAEAERKAVAEKARAERDAMEMAEREAAERKRIVEERESAAQAEQARRREAERRRQLAEQNERQRRAQQAAQLAKDAEFDPVSQAHIVVQQLINNGQILGAQYVTETKERIAAPPSAPAGARRPIVITTSGRAADYPDYDVRCYVVFDFYFVTQAGFRRNNRGYLVFSRDRGSGRWVFNRLLSTIDGVSRM